MLIIYPANMLCQESLKPRLIVSTYIDMFNGIGYNCFMKKCACSSYPLDKLCLSLRAIAESNRLKMLCLLKNGEKCVCEITEALNIPHNLALHHIKKMKRSGLIRSSNRGRFTFYRIDKKTLDGQLKILLRTLK